MPDPNSPRPPAAGPAASEYPGRVTGAAGYSIDDSLVTLKDACEIAFNGKIKVATLRAEIGRGNLTVFRVGRRDFTTLKHVREMVQRRCRAASPLQGSISTGRGETGLSETERLTSAQAALNLTLAGLKGRSLITSDENTGPSPAPRRRSSISS